ncbi:iron-sulfur cluster assembly 1 homolog, mitochondrial isoform X3 [Cherax quadricarinatus]|uniref:iron-sulfur cluster assembly 1 homolog, mitochondrial isoform X3 n=1 Tax=Cherax quadricarinatus TaxID=27406 RepID=UPI0023780CF5|nr:iron-sulfur cluster assembly 1 homolog, mitochondrial-like isoform X3 [Cherax quadricarinatus]
MVKVTTMMMAASVVVTASVRAVKGRRLVPTRAALVLVRLSAAKPTWVVVMTQSAVQKVRELLKENPEALGLKVGVRQRGCNGLSYVLDYATEKGKFDEEVVQDGTYNGASPTTMLNSYGAQLVE